MKREWCTHYRGMHKKDACEAGVRFSDLPRYGTTGFMDACPCFGPNGDVCDKAVYPTAAEMAAAEEAVQRRFAQTVMAREAIVEALGGPWKKGTPGAAGKIDCPVCKQANALHFSRAGYNGHIHARCTTDGCVSWME